MLIFVFVYPSARYAASALRGVPVCASVFAVLVGLSTDKLSFPAWLITYRDGLAVCRRSPIQVLTETRLV